MTEKSLITEKMRATVGKPLNFGRNINMQGRVKNKYYREGGNYVECELWVENQDGRIAAPGQASVSLPAKVDK
jgi:hypothetical protein